MSANLDNILNKIGISSPARRVYIALLDLKEATASQLANNLGMARPSVYDQIRLLKKRGLVTEFEKDNKKSFRVDNPKVLLNIIHEKVDDLKHEEARLKSELPKLIKNAETPEPRIKFYEGVESFRQVLTDVLWYENTEVLVMWPFGDMKDVIGEEYLKSFTERRIKSGITVRSIWARGKNTYVEKISKETTRVAPPGMNWHMGYIIYGEKVAFISSRYESFAFVVASRDFSELKRAEFEQIWKVSKTAKLTPL